MRPFNISSTVQKILGFQAAFRPAFQYPSSRTMSSLPSPSPDVQRILKYWFEAPDVPDKWFQGGDKVDAEIKYQFGDLVEKARASELEAWTEEPKSTLALIVLLDQFSRNLFRGSPLSWSKDSMALNIMTQAIAKGFDRELSPMQQQFFYLPLMHDENLISQIAAKALYEALFHRCDKDSKEQKFVQRSQNAADSHIYCIAKFGRFPSRNKILGRTSTPEEEQYLIEHPYGF
ncbi:hypothetical protein B0J14DRAFT_606611 [Halenospora varia]|nr:hypothetical protein B0J14DRAFT_606611 [Halenospora varia]